MFAGHLPYVWDQKGPTTDKIADDVTAVPGRKRPHALVGGRACGVRPRRHECRRPRRPRRRRAADGERRRRDQRAGCAQPVQGDQRARPTAAAVVRQRAIGAGADAGDRHGHDDRRFAAGGGIGGRPAGRRRPVRRCVPGAAGSGAASGRRREGELRSLDLLRERRCARRLRQQPDSRSRRRPAQRRRRRHGRRRRSGRSPGPRIDGRVAADCQNREVDHRAGRRADPGPHRRRRIRSSIS